MHKVEILKSKNDSLTCKIDGISIHSAYNPQIEAVRFVENFKSDFIPKCIFLIEPGLNYLEKAFSEKYPSSKIVCIRFLNDFSEYNHAYFKVHDFKNAENFENFILRNFSEEELLSSIFVDWPSTAKIFSNESTAIWNSIKNTLNRSKTLLFTRSYFTKRWIKNSFNYFSYAENFSTISKTNFPVVITASGSSLKNCLETLKNNRDKFLLISLSSSLNPLLKNNIIPDLVISTDGGYWAKTHLTVLRKHPEIPLLLSPEGNISKTILKNQCVVPAVYTDGFESIISKKVFDALNISPVEIVRNGTVSGTALEFALNLTTNKIFFFGLDLASSKGFQHLQPNLIELNSSLKDNFIQTSELRSVSSEQNCDSLKIYENWFKSFSTKCQNRVFRIYKDYNFKNSLGEIQDKEIAFFEKNLSEKTNLKFEKVQINKDSKINIKNTLFNYLEENSTKEIWKKSVFPSDYLIYEKLSDTSEKQKQLEKINRNTSEFIKELERIVNCIKN